MKPVIYTSQKFHHKKTMFTYISRPQHVAWHILQVSKQKWRYRRLIWNLCQTAQSVAASKKRRQVEVYAELQADQQQSVVQGEQCRQHHAMSLILYLYCIVTN